MNYMYIYMYLALPRISSGGTGLSGKVGSIGSGAVRVGERSVGNRCLKTAIALSVRTLNLAKAAVSDGGGSTS